jgi:hypothetical protein
MSRWTLLYSKRLWLATSRMPTRLTMPTPGIYVGSGAAKAIAHQKYYHKALLPHWTALSCAVE